MDGRRVAYLAAACELLLLLLPVAAAVPVDSESAPCNVKDCPNYRAIRHYEQLGCRRSDGSNDCCPTRFNCSSLLSLERSKCYYKGKVYDLGTQILQATKSMCKASCACVDIRKGTFKEEAQFHCTNTDCPGQPLLAGCVRTYSFDGCCSTGVHCEDHTESRKEVTQCTYNGRTFLEGQYMETSDSDCLMCICQAGFDGTLDGPWCRKYTCDYTLGESYLQLVTCAPIFWGTTKCCPIGWHCPSPGDDVIRRSGAPTGDDEQCYFGDHRLKIGEELRTNRSPCVICRCDIPPLVTCSQLLELQCSTHTN